MAEVTRRRTGALLRELFSILMAAPAGLQASAALQALAQRMTLTSPAAAPNSVFVAWGVKPMTRLS